MAAGESGRGDWWLRPNLEAAGAHRRQSMAADLKEAKPMAVSVVRGL